VLTRSVKLSRFLHISENKTHLGYGTIRSNTRSSKMCG